MAASTTTLATVLSLLALSALPGCDEGGTAIGPEGGIVVSDDGRVTLEVPAGALPNEAHLSIGSDPGPANALGEAYRIDPRGLQFHRPATLTYDFAPELDPGDEASALRTRPIDRLTLLTRKAQGWEPLADRDLDEEGQQISGSVLFLSSYAVVLP